MPTDDLLANRVHRYAGLSAIVSMAVGLVVLIGWVGESESLKTVSGQVSMKANTALGFILLGGALWLIRDEPVSGVARSVSQSAAVLVSVFAALTLAEYLTGTNLGIDGLFDDSAASGAPGRPGPHTAVAFLALGIWMAVLPLNGRRQLWARYVFGVVSCIVVFQASMGVLFQVSYLSGTKALTGMALHTMLTALVLCVGMVAARPRQGFMGVMTSSGVGGHMGRRLALAVVVLPLLIAFLGLEGQAQGWYGARDGVAILAGATVLLVGTITFVTAQALNRSDAERVRLEARLRELADRDPMTGLYNRRGFDKEADRAVAVAQRYGGRLAVIALDVDGLKEVNDAYGHAAGDELLTSLTERWRSALRETDVLARLGGDEFAVLLPPSDPAGSEERVAQKLIEVARTPFPGRQTRSADVSVSGGIAVAGDEPFDCNALLLAADEALYRAKAAGGDRYVVSAPAAIPALS